MRLKQLKLAGFKSFVDSTLIPFPSQLVAVVGPNGCGKSNIMDSVRWVMGESSAKNLRSECMADVIFNGSSHRKPVGQASVELVFENDKGRISGQYANYQELSIKRLVTRDGESNYYLNGTRCRRRDISELFLGTGAGAKGYAIIGQDMISRLIEARPEELRAYLEEAAGVSKYKERRRETCNRIKHTEDNIDRVNDVLEELSKQLERLEKQAKTAEKYKKLKTEERQGQTQILALKWLHYDKKKHETLKKLQKANQLKEETKSKITRVEKHILILQGNLHITEQKLHLTNEQYYRVGKEIARIEAALEQKRQEKKRLCEALDALEQEHHSTKDLMAQDEQDLSLRQQALQEISGRYVQREKDYQQACEQEHQKEAMLRTARDAWQQHEQEFNLVSHQLERYKLQIEHIVSRRQDLILQIEQNQDARQKMDLDEVEASLNTLLNQQREHQRESLLCEKASQDARTAVKSLRLTISNHEKIHREASSQLQKMSTQYAAEQAGLQASMSTSCQALDKSRWNKHLRLLERLEVDAQWTKAVELVLGDGLEGVLVDSLKELEGEWQQIKTYTGSFITKKSKAEKHLYPRLSEKMTGILPHWPIDLNGVFAAKNLDEALSWLPNILEHQSVVTQDGIWIGFGWVKVKPVHNQEHKSLLERKKQIRELVCLLDEKKKETEKLALQTKTYHANLEQLGQEDEQASEILIQKKHRLSQLDAEVRHKQQSLLQQRSNHLALVEAFEALNERLEQLMEERVCTDTEMASLQLRKQRLDEQANELKIQLERSELSHKEVAAKLKAVGQLKQDAALIKERESLYCEQLKERIHRGNQQLELIVKKQIKAKNDLEALDMSDEALNSPLNDKNNQYIELEQSIKAQKEDVLALQDKIKEEAAEKQVFEQGLGTIVEQLQEQQIEEQTLEVKLAGITDSLTEYKKTPAMILDTLDEDLDISQIEKTLESLRNRIMNLGAINLVAIEEYQQELARKHHLDGQLTDLSEALSLLKKAIQKMDKETESRFKATFDEVNQSFQSLFPKLFGGGRAKLNLTCDNLLEAGIVVSAQPPGKKNSTIYMLSGGEKSMTAIALVFAIFQLNPAPFCLLDEVDAPLDEANVRRFCQMVKEMSEYVQFLFITHNKVTMELAEQLIGVTMREPGVSRVVAVDMGEALNYAES